MAEAVSSKLDKSDLILMKAMLQNGHIKSRDSNCGQLERLRSLYLADRIESFWHGEIWKLTKFGQTVAGNEYAQLDFR